jgi:hypothetical protein
VSSQGWSGAEPLGRDGPKMIEPRRGGRAECRRARSPLRGYDVMGSGSRGSAALHPWLFTAAPPGLKQHHRRHPCRGSSLVGREP